MIIQTLLHRDNVKDFVLIARSFSGEYFAPYLLTEEQLYFNRFSHNFYQLLLSDLNDNWATANEWINGDYVAGDIVIWNGELWQAENDTCNTPDEGWIKLNRFKSECYNILWYNFLGKIISGYVFKAAVPNINFKASPKGVTMSGNDSYESADFKTLGIWIDTFEVQTERTTSAMFNYISRSDSSCFDELKKCFPCESESDCGKIDRETNSFNLIAVGNTKSMANCNDAMLNILKAGGFKPVTDEVFNERIETCLKCDEHEGEGKELKCKICGCCMMAKARFTYHILKKLGTAKIACDLQKW